MKKLLLMLCLIAFTVNTFANYLSARRASAQVYYTNSCGTWRATMHYTSSSNPVANQINFYNRYEQFVEASNYACQTGRTKMAFDEEPVDGSGIDYDNSENEDVAEDF